MKIYQIRIEENKPRNSYIIARGERPGELAMRIIEDDHVREGAHVRFACVEFDYPNNEFKATTFAFDVKDGKPENLTTIS